MRVAAQPLHVMHADADADVPDASNCSSPLHLAGTWMNDLDRNEAVKFINHVTTVEKMPFFLYLATTTPHSGFLQGGSGPKPPGYVNDYPVPYPYGIARARAHTHTHTHTHLLTHTRARAHTHTHLHARSHIHLYTYRYYLQDCLVLFFRFLFSFILRTLF